ncbi:hypothetical protein ZIOFF_069178 [Zingiber officinale]|uniref:Uncharacterized protein n=1 Tax=Zingiber officinale TaxID=94328 RepID=A0A8J5CBD8_ZINOF|nr:hypothetical protein ZIOFF_069178 [Zingiber officinale]
MDRIADHGKAGKPIAQPSGGAASVAGELGDVRQSFVLVLSFGMERFPFLRFIPPLFPQPVIGWDATLEVLGEILAKPVTDASM